MKNKISSALLALTVFATFCNCEYRNDLVGNWRDRGEVNARGRGGATCFVIDNKAYLVGGRGYYKTETYFKDTWQFDPETKSWKQFDTVPCEKGRYYSVGFAIDGKGYYGTGIGKSAVYFKDFYEFDPTVDNGEDKLPGKWTKTDSIPGDPIYGMVGFSIDGIGYAGAGYTKETGYANTYYSFDPKAEDGKKWQIVEHINPSKRCNGSVFIIDNRAYIVGGTNNSRLVRDFERFDPSEEKGDLRWYKISQDFEEDYNSTRVTKVYRHSAAAFTINGRGYLCCGSLSSVGGKSDVWEYTPYIGPDHMGRWDEICSFEGTARFACQGFAIDGIGYVACGMSGTSESSFFDDVWEFHPNEDYEKRIDR